MTTPQGDAEQIHDLVQSINAQQADADRETTIVQQDD